MTILKDDTKLVRAVKLAHKRYQTEKENISEKKDIFLKTNFRLGDVSDDDKIFKDEISKVYFVAGILHCANCSTIFQQVLLDELGGILKSEEDVVLFDDVFYLYTEYLKVEAVISHMENTLSRDCKMILKNSGKIVIFAHSWGGIIAQTAVKRVLQKLKKQLSIKEYEYIKASIVLVTMGTPHTMVYGGILSIKKRLKAPKLIFGIKTFTFGGIFDVIVPAKFAHLDTDNKSHLISSSDLRSTHLMFLRSQKIIRQVINSVIREREHTKWQIVIGDIWRTFLKMLSH